MRKLVLTLTAALLLTQTGSALAGGTHTGGHEEYDIGKRGEKWQSKRFINITMRETQEGKMIFEPKELEFSEGETVTLNLTNSGATDHEFVMDSVDKVVEHKAVMEKNPDMEHADDNALRLAPGKKGQIVWTFKKSGKFMFACLIPGHFDAGMNGPIMVKAK